MRLVQLPETIESYRDRSWCREPELRIEDPFVAETFMERVGFCAVLTDSRRPGPSLYIAVCGRRDAHMPRNVQKDPESSLAWKIKDEVVRRGRVYYGKLRGNRAIFVARRLVPHFRALAVAHRGSQPLSEEANSILKVLRKEWEMASRDLRHASGISDRYSFNKALDELQKAFKVIPSEIVYKPVFTYIWSLAEARFQDELKQDITREEALIEVARTYLTSAGLTLRGELARVTGLSNPDAGLGNWGLVDEGFASRVEPGVYRLKDFDSESLADSVTFDRLAQS